MLLRRRNIADRLSKLSISHGVCALILQPDTHAVFDSAAADFHLGSVSGTYLQRDCSAVPTMVQHLMRVLDVLDRAGTNTAGCVRRLQDQRYVLFRGARSVR